MIEMKQTRRRRTVSRAKAVVACLLCLVVGAAAALGGLWACLGRDGRALLRAWQLIDEKFVGEYDREEHLHATLETMVDALGDRWSYYLTPERYAQTVDTRANSYVGIGITIDRTETDGIRIRSVTPDSPAEACGLVAGEIIRAVDGTPVNQETLEDCIDAIKGEEGTSVRLDVEGADGTVRSVEAERRAIHGVTATWEMVEGDVALLTIDAFYAGTADQVRRSLEELTAQGAVALVVDVRYDPGGYVSELTEILDLLLPEGDIFISRSYDGEETVYTSDAACIDLPLAVLANSESYSAAEFLAAQLRESAGAVIVGTQTSGKGFSQNLFALPDGSGIGLSTGRYFTGGGVSLIGVGVEPDITVALPQAAEEKLAVGQLPHEEDLQLQAAIRALDLGP